MEYLAEKLEKYEELVVSEYVCSKCNQVFWAPQTFIPLHCPFCGENAIINGDVCLKGNKKKSHKKK